MHTHSWTKWAGADEEKLTGGPACPDTQNVKLLDMYLDDCNFGAVEISKKERMLWSPRSGKTLGGGGADWRL